MRWLYNILFTIALWLTSPWLLLRLRRRGGWREKFAQRFGRFDSDDLPPRDPGRRRLWLHAVSVGEVNTCVQFVHALAARRASLDIVVSTTTTTGMAELRKKLPPCASPIYFPVDQRRCVVRSLDAVRPDAVILVEREVWPNFLWELRKRGCRLLLINARISERSHRAYRRFGFLFRALYAQFDLVAAQTEEDAQRMRDVGCRAEVLHVLGSMKFDAAHATTATALDVAEMLHCAGRKAGAPVLVAGSTHDGEELLLARAAQKLRQEFPDLFLVLVPRHFERAGEVVAQLRELRIAPLLRSSLRDPATAANHSSQCLLVDSTGELTAFYAEADLVFIGKSLCAHGGQNPIEPALLGKPMVFGPNMQNFPGVTQQLLAGEAAVEVADEAGLQSALADLLRSPDRRHRLGENALEVVRRNAGATERTVSLVLEQLDVCAGRESGMLPPRRQRFRNF